MKKYILAKYEYTKVKKERKKEKEKQDVVHNMQLVT